MNYQSTQQATEPCSGHLMALAYKGKSNKHKKTHVVKVNKQQDKITELLERFKSFDENAVVINCILLADHLKIRHTDLTNLLEFFNDYHDFLKANFSYNLRIVDLLFIKKFEPFIFCEYHEIIKYLHRLICFIDGVPYVTSFRLANRLKINHKVILGLIELLNMPKYFYSIECSLKNGEVFAYYKMTLEGVKAIKEMLESNMFVSIMSSCK